MASLHAYVLAISTDNDNLPPNFLVKVYTDPISWLYKSIKIYLGTSLKTPLHFMYVYLYWFS